MGQDPAHGQPERCDDAPHAAADTWSLFLVFLRLGLTSFGGPIAHLGYFREEFVVRRKWLRDAEYAELVALCQFLPGPASSQVGMAIGLRRAGVWGAVAAWCGFTLPSALLMIGFALGLSRWGQWLPSGVLHGVMLMAVVVVAQAVWGMARMFCRDLVSWLVMIAAAALLLRWPMAAMQWGVLGFGALAGMLRPAKGKVSPGAGLTVGLPRSAAALALLAFFLLLATLPWLGARLPGSTLDMLAAFYRAGALVFGGGHVVLPLLESGVVATGWMPVDTFLSGYGAAQALPGPLFAFAGFLGAGIAVGPGGWSGGVLALIAIFLPSFLLVLGVLPFWQRLRARRWMQAALAGVNAAVVGLLLAALYHPIWTSTVRAPADLLGVMLGLLALIRLRLPPWAVAALLALAGWGAAHWA